MVLEPGMLARSKAGHDKNCIYVMISVNDEYVYLADGNKRSVCLPKRKNRKHVQAITCLRSGSVADDKSVREAINSFVNKEMQ